MPRVDGASDGGFILVVGAAVVDDLERPTTLLAARRTEPPHLAGGWELPGGKVDPGEDPLAALHREVAEELGVTIEVGNELLGPDGDPGPPGWPLPPGYRMRVWWVRVVDGVPAPIESHDAVRVLGPGEWFDVAWLPADVPIVRALAAVREARPAPIPPRPEHRPSLTGPVRGGRRMG